MCAPSPLLDGILLAVLLAVHGVASFAAAVLLPEPWLLPCLEIDVAELRDFASGRGAGRGGSGATMGPVKYMGSADSLGCDEAAPDPSALFLRSTAATLARASEAKSARRPAALAMLS